MIQVTIRKMIYRSNVMTLVADLNYRDVISLCIVTLQILMALYYYTPLNKDIMDERFSWRMFSEVTLTDRELEWEGLTVISGYNATKRISMEKRFTKIWAVILKRGEDTLLNRAVEYLCDMEPVDYIRYVFSARFLDGRLLTKDVTRRCSTDLFKRMKFSSRWIL